MAKNPIISSIQDYVILAIGAYDWKEGQFFTVKGKPKSRAYVLSSTTDQAYLLIDTASNDFEINDELVEDEQFVSAKTSMEFFGHIIDIDGKCIDDSSVNFKNFINQDSKVFSIAEDMMHRTRLNEQLATGILSIDIFNPIGLGQRELIIGDRQTGKTHIVLNAIINQKRTKVKCIYVSIGQKRQNLSYVYKTLKDHGALENTIIIEAPVTSPFQQFLAPYVAMAHAENLCYEHDVLIVFDDLSKHASIYREIALLTNKPISKEAYPADIFYAHSQLLERSGKFVGKKSITALPILRIIDNDITSLIASNIISITDGQIVTNAGLFAEGKIPAVDVDLSVSRTGSSVQSKTMGRIASSLSKTYRAYRKQTKLSKINFDLNKETTELLKKGEQIQNMLIQKGFSYQATDAILLSAKIIEWGLLNNISRPDLAIKFIDALVSVDARAKKIFTSLINNKPIDDAIARDYIANAVNQYFKSINVNEVIETKLDFVSFNANELKTIISNIKEI